MTENELKEFLLRSYPIEDEKCDWKEMKNLKNSFNGHEGEDVMSYVSGIANMEGGDLVIGVEDKTLNIIGTDLTKFNLDKNSAVLKIKENCVNISSEGLSVDEYITSDTQKTVWVIHIPKHLPRKPVYAHKHAWQRIKDSLVFITPERESAILNESVSEGNASKWTATVLPDATLDDLDPKAILKAREQYKEVYPSKAKEVDSWDDIKFLNKAKITIKGKITIAAIILLGKEESEHYLLPSVCKIRWTLKNEKGENLDYEIFSIPMILAIDEVGKKIRNTKYEYTIAGNMFPEPPMYRYDVFTLREPLNNAIGHQDYKKDARIEVIEYDNDHLVFQNYGSFLPGSVEKVVLEDSPESIYRNPFLIEAMRNVHMVETEGGGIRKLFEQQRKRFFPMPEYDLSGGKVKVTIDGKVIDEQFAKILVQVPDMSMSDILLLDKVQKQKRLSDDEIKYMRKKKLIEGRKPNVFLSRNIVRQTKDVGLKATYVKNKSFDDEYFRKLIIQYLEKFSIAKRSDIDDLLMGKLSDVLTIDQKKNKIKNLLYQLRKNNIIETDHSRNWSLSDRFRRKM
uniref:ATP-binding protein n=2 Tax=Prevotella sp. TaxID=59823 RepID=UPI003FF08B40